MKHLILALPLVALAACATAPQSGTVAPKGELGQGHSSATAAMYKSAATSEQTASLAPEGHAVGGAVTVPFALWNAETKAWQIPLDAKGNPYMVTATAVRDFTYVVAGTVTNSATVSGSAQGTQNQAGQTGQTATPTNTVSPNTTLSVPVK